MNDVESRRRMIEVIVFDTKLFMLVCVAFPATMIAFFIGVKLGMFVAKQQRSQHERS